MMASAPHTPAQGPALAAIGFAPMPAVARVLAGFQRDQLASFVEVAIGLLDLADGDADEEDNGDDELTGDEADTGWTEHHTRGRHKLASGMSEPFADHEDDEEDDPSGQCDEDGINTNADLALSTYPGCPIGDPDYGVDDERHDEPDQDKEREQMGNDVPMLPVVTLDTNIFTDQRQPLGICNLQSSFRTNGGEVRSADTGVLHRSTGECWPRTPGVPV